MKTHSNTGAAVMSLDGNAIIGTRYCTAYMKNSRCMREQKRCFLDTNVQVQPFKFIDSF